MVLKDVELMEKISGFRNPGERTCEQCLGNVMPGARCQRCNTPHTEYMEAEKELPF